MLLGFRYESLWWYVFGVAFIAVILGETLRPQTKPATIISRRWTANTVLLVACTGISKLAYGVSGLALALSLQGDRFGLLHHLPLSPFVSFGIGFLMLDLTHYATHRLLHSYGILWRVHRIHHSEDDLDATTGFRFHPAEALLAQGVPLLVIALLGLPASAVMAGELVALVQDFFTHANLSLPAPWERWLRALMITPGLHRTHHSEVIAEQNTNFGTVFSFWDRLFGTYLAEPADGAEMRCGLTELKAGSSLNGFSLLALPFRPEPDSSQSTNTYNLQA